MRIRSLSPRSTAPYQTLASSASSTRPITWALSATQALAAMRGTSSVEFVDGHRHALQVQSLEL